MLPHQATRDTVTVYRPNQRHDVSFLRTLALMARNVWHAREMILQLVHRDLTAQYKKSFIGAFWILAAPIMQVIPWVFAARVHVYNPGQLDIPLEVYLLVGRSMWSLFFGFYTGAAATLGSGGGLIGQVTYPHEAMLFKQIIVGLVNYCLSFLVALGVMCAYGVYPSWASLFFPLTILPIFFLGVAMGLTMSMVKVVAYDLDRVINIVMGLLMWTTPLLYSDKHPPSNVLRTINDYNPLTYLVCTCRDVLLHGHVYAGAVGVYVGCAGVSFLLFLIALRVFYVSEHRLVERMLT